MSDIGRALTRKFGPLPAWAWAGIFAAAMYLYRRSSMFAAAGGTPPATGTSTSATDPTISDGTGGGGGSPMTLDPGQSVYDPTTGHLLGTAPDQQPPDVATASDPQTPITLQPGETVYDPNTGQLVGGTPAGRSTAATAETATKKKKKKSTKHTAKKKPQHTSKHRKIHLPTHNKVKPRGHAKLQGAHHSPHKTTGAKGRHTPNITPQKAATRPVSKSHHGSVVVARGHSPGNKSEPASVNRRNPVRAVAARITAPALRQRPAAPKIVHPSTQKVATHPAFAVAPARTTVVRAPAAAPAPRPAAPRPAPAPHHHAARRRR